MKKIFLSMTVVFFAGLCIAQTNIVPTDGNVGFGTLAPSEKLSINGGHANTRLGLHFDHPDITKTADLLIWASEPGWTFTGAGIGNNVAITSGISRFNVHKGGSYIRLLDQQISLNLLKMDGTDLSAMAIDPQGNIGVGVLGPVAKLDVNGGLNLKDGYHVTWGGVYGPNIPTIASSSAAGINFYPSGSTSDLAMKIASNGNILIGTAVQNNIHYRLDVNGKARVNELVVNTTGADFVFEDNYRLKSLEELESFIQKYKHLPDIQPADAMQKNGLAVGEMQTKLLQKIEELTLHLIEKDKQLKKQFILNKSYDERLRRLEERNIRLKK